MESGHQASVPSMTPSLVGGGLSHSSYSSGIFYQGDGQPQSVGNTHLSSSFGTSSNSVLGATQASGDASDVMLNSMTNSGPSVGASSLVTDANSGLSGGPHLQRSASFNTDSYMRLPASPISFTSNNLSVSGSSIMDATSVGQQCSNQEPNSQQVQLIQPQQGVSGTTNLSAARMGQFSISAGSRVPGSLIQDTSMSQMHKKARLEVKKEDILPQQVRQQLMLRQDTHDPQMQALMQHQALRQHQQQQLVQSMTSIQRLQFFQQQHQLSMRQQQQFSRQQQQISMRQQLQQPNTQQLSGIKRPFESGVCANRLMQYLYHQQQRPAENSFVYWKKFVAEYYSPRSKTRWCLSQYDNVGHNSLGVFPQSTMDAWQCEICGSKSGRGFEATSEVLPRLNQIKFDSGVIDELLFLDLPNEVRYPNGVMVLQYEKAVQETVYEQLRVIRRGQLRVLFSPDLKILSWEFCARRHEEFISRKLIAPQVNQLLQVAQKCQNTINESGPDGISQQELQANSNMVLAGGRQLAKTLELQSLNDLGFSKRYFRCLQISEVVNSMKDLMDLCKAKKAGPVDCLKSYHRQSSSTKLQMATTTDTEQLTGAPIPTPTNSSSSLNPGINNNQMGNFNNNHAAVGRVGTHLSNNNYQTILTRQNTMNPNSNSLHHQQQQQQGILPSINHNNSNGGGGGGQRVATPAGGNFTNGQRFIPGNNNSLIQPITHQQVLSGYHPHPSSSGTNSPRSVPLPAQAPSRSNSFKGGPSNSDSNVGSRNSNNHNSSSSNKVVEEKEAAEAAAEAAASDLSNYLNLPDNMFQDFAENGLFGGDDDSLDYAWK